ncbi:J domain-containing protein [Vulcanococcus limneticus]|uniref:J domain-containing protein n=1 Tax=Vulcanococcus limneticus TaxID=2170428 RepID=UPI00398BCC27
MAEPVADQAAQSGRRVMPCPGCSRSLSVAFCVEPVLVQCPVCHLNFHVRSSGLAEDVDVWVQPSGPALASHYQVLGIDPQADRESIKAAYRQAALRWHPDRNGNSEDAVARFHQVARAYAVLSDQRQRDSYDASIAAGNGSSWRRVAAVPDGSRSTQPERENRDHLVCDLEFRESQEVEIGDSLTRRRQKEFYIKVAIGLVVGVAAGVLIPRSLRVGNLLFYAFCFYGLLSVSRAAVVFVRARSRSQEVMRMGRWRP